MATATSTTDSLTVVEIFDATVEKVFDCFTQPALLQQWMGPGTVSCPNVVVDLQVGGEFRIEMQNQEGEKFIALGEYKEIDPPNKLVYTWRWENGEHPATTITVSFKEQGTKTEMEFIQTGFATPESAKSHFEGWGSCFEKLLVFLSGPGKK